jgi:hypothetical protein
VSIQEDAANSSHLFRVVRLHLEGEKELYSANSFRDAAEWMLRNARPAQFALVLIYPDGSRLSQNEVYEATRAPLG